MGIGVQGILSNSKGLHFIPRQAGEKKDGRGKTVIGGKYRKNT